MEQDSQLQKLSASLSFVYTSTIASGFCHKRRLALSLSEEQVIEALRDCYDPEIPVNVYDLGLVYDIDIDEDKVSVDMTLTAPGCPVAGTLGPEIQMRLLSVEGVNDAEVNIVWDPPWPPDMLRPEGRELLAGLM